MLARPSRVLFGLAMTTHGNRKQSAACKAILGEGTWDELDFEDFDNNVTSRITDDDICTILTFINARKSLRKLRVAGCVNIVGSGLEPLRGERY